MKLKYYMRGLGIGMVLTTIILSVSDQRNTLSDKDIIRRAEQLGMVMQEEEDNLDKVLKESDNQELSITPAVTPAVTQKPDDETKPTPITPSPTVTITPTPEPTLKPEPTMKPKPTNMPSKDETSEDKSNEDKEYSFTIERGMSSYEVAKMLHEIGLVEDLVGFDKYLMEEGKSKIIRVGAYSIKNGASFDEIAEIITEE